MLSDKNLVLVGGCFDIIHHGHIEFLKGAKKHGFVLVALESDHAIKKYKHRNPVNNQTSRAVNLISLPYVDDVLKLKLLTSYDDYLDMVCNIKPSIIAITEHDPLIEQKRKQAKEVGATVKIVTPPIEGISTTKILERRDRLKPEL